MPYACRPFLPILAAFATVAGLAGASPAQAQVSTTSLAGWSVIGDAVSQGGAITLTTASLDVELAGDPASNLSGRSAADIALVETAAGVAVYGLDLSVTEAGTEGSLVGQTFAGTAGQTLRFDWSFSSLETAFLDRAFVALNGVVTTLATTAAPGSASQSFSTTLTGSGPFSLAIGVIDTVDDLGVSSLTVRNLQLAVAAVPEPTNVALLLAGLAVLVGMRKRAPGTSAADGG